MSIFRELQRRNVLRVAAGYVAVSWLIVQVMDTLSGAFEFTDANIRTAVIILAVCFVPVMIISWAFELTPEGLKRDAAVSRDTPASKRLARRMDRFIMAMLAIALTYFVIDELFIETGTPPTKAAPSIAVLPFVNLSADPEQEYFSSGISEEMLNLLARIPELRVISRSSSFRFRGEGVDIPDVARQLGVTWVLEGSVRKAGDTIRITAQLIDGRNDAHVWSETWDRKLDDIFAIQDEIAAQVVERLQVTLLNGMPRVLRGNPRAFELTAMARAIVYPSSDNADESREDARNLLRQALEIDPDYIPAILLLANLDYWNQLDADQLDPVAYETMLRNWASVARRCLEIDPTHPTALLGAAWVEYEVERDFQAAADLFERALAAAPSDDEILRVASAFARQIGKFDESIAIAERWSAIDPFCRVCNTPWRTAFRQYEAGHYDEALETFAQVTPDQEFPYSVALQTRAKVLLLRARPGEALSVLDLEGASTHATDFEAEALRAIALWHLGQYDAAREIRDRHAEVARGDWEARPVLAIEHAWMGELDEAFAILYDLYWPHMFRFRNVVQDPMWRPLHEDPRWRELLVRSGYTPEALAAVEFNPRLSE